MKSSGVIFEHARNDARTVVVDLSPLTRLRTRTTTNTHQPKHTAHTSSWNRLLGLGMIALALGGLTGPMIPRILLETRYLALKGQAFQKAFRLLQTVPAIFDPLKTPDGASIDPVNREFSLLSQNRRECSGTPVVNPTKPGEYLAALQKALPTLHSHFPMRTARCFEPHRPPRLVCGRPTPPFTSSRTWKKRIWSCCFTKGLAIPIESPANR